MIFDHPGSMSQSTPPMTVAETIALVLELVKNPDVIVTLEIVTD